MPPTKRSRTDSYRQYGPRMRSGAFYKRDDPKPDYVQRQRSSYASRFSGPSGELKVFDTTLSFNFDATGEVPATGQLNLIPQGVTDSTRVGRKCTVKSVHLKGNVVFAPAAGANAATTAFLYVIHHTPTNGAAAAITDVLTSNNMSTALINIANSQRFRVLKKFKWSLNSGAGVTTAYNNVVRHQERYKKCEIPIGYSSTTGAITEIRTNNIFLLAGTDSASDDTVSFGGTCRVRFSDN